MNNPTAYPLYWPMGWPRTKYPTVSSRLKTSLPGALENVQAELRRFGHDTGKTVSALIISSNVCIGIQRPADAGIAVYFRWDNSDCCIAVDRYSKPEENLQAIALIIEAERAKMRHGGLNIVRAAFRGYVGLPPSSFNGGQIPRPWWAALQFPSDAGLDLNAVESRYRELVKKHHPDVGGDPSRFAEIADAIRCARETLR